MTNTSTPNTIEGTPTETDIGLTPDQVMPELKAIIESSKQPAIPDNVRVLLHNDDLTPYQTVVEILVGIFGHDTEAARRLMFQVHRTKQPGIVCVIPEAEADDKIARAGVASTGYPLTFSKEKA